MSAVLRDYYDRVVGKSIDHPDNDPDDLYCEWCHGDGTDPYNDHVLPCPMCRSSEHAAIPSEGAC